MDKWELLYQVSRNTKWIGCWEYNTIYILKWFRDLWTEDLAQITQVKSRCRIVSEVQGKYYKGPEESKYSYN